MAERIKIEKLHAGYRLLAYPHRSLVIQARDLLDIMDYALEHAEELRQEAEQARQMDLKSKGVGEEQEYQPIAGDWRVQEVGTSYLFWQWRDGAWEFSERIDDEINAGDFIEHMNPVGKSGEYDYWRP